MRNISIIVAVDGKYGMGYKGKLPWHFSSDLKHFKKITEGHTVVMGRKTWESIGKPLPNRTNVVLSKQNILLPQNVTLLKNIDEVLDLQGDIFIIGGSEIYKQFFPYATYLYITSIEYNYECDTFFEGFNRNEWMLSVDKVSSTVENNILLIFKEFFRK